MGFFKSLAAGPGAISSGVTGGISGVTDAAKDVAKTVEDTVDKGLDLIEGMVNQFAALLPILLIGGAVFGGVILLGQVKQLTGSGSGNTIVVQRP